LEDYEEANRKRHLLRLWLKGSAFSRPFDPSMNMFWGSKIRGRMNGITAHQSRSGANQLSWLRLEVPMDWQVKPKTGLLRAVKAIEQIGAARSCYDPWPNYSALQVFEARNTRRWASTQEC